MTFVFDRADIFSIPSSLFSLETVVAFSVYKILRMSVTGELMNGRQISDVDTFSSCTLFMRGTGRASADAPCTMKENILFFIKTGDPFMCMPTNE